MKENNLLVTESYKGLLHGVVHLLEAARKTSARSVNTIMTATYWEIGRRIVEHEQKGKRRADYGEALIERLATDLTVKFGRGFSRSNLWQMREFYLAWPIVHAVPAQLQSMNSPQRGRGKLQTLSGVFGVSAMTGNLQTASGESGPSQTGAFPRFPLPWSHYVRLLSVRDVQARRFYESEALRGGWSVRQLDRQISALFYERAALSRNKAAMLRKGQHKLPNDQITPEEEIKDPLVLEFLGLKDEYSESTLAVVYCESSWL